MVEVGILGPLVVQVDGREVAVGGPKQRALLALLVLHRNEVVSSETLVDQMWAGRPPATAAKIVHGYVSRLRKAFGDGLLETRPGGYRLCLPPDSVDVTRFERLLQRGNALLAADDPAAAATTLRECLSLWRGPPLAELRGVDTAADESDRLAELRVLALESRAEADISLGAAAGTIPELQALIREHPLRENLRGLLMVALYRTGRQADALAVYRNARATLVEELGIEPGAALRNLEAAILKQDPALAVPVAAPRPPVFDRQPPGPETPGHPTLDTPVPANAPDAAGMSSVPGPHTEHGRRPSRRRWLRWRRTAVAAAGALAAGAFIVAPVTDGGTPVTVAGALPADAVGFIGVGATAVSAPAPVSGAPSAVAVDGTAVWAVEPAADVLVRIDARTGSVTQTIAVGKDPSDVAVGGGSVWVANHDDNTVSRISPETDAVVQTIHVGAGPESVAVGSGSVWVTDSDDRSLTRIDDSAGTVSATIDTNAIGRGVAVGGGAVWVTDEATNRVVEVDPTTDAVGATATVGNGPTGIAYHDGSVWVVNALDGTVSRLDTARLAVAATISISGGASSISAAAGNVWVGAESGSMVVRIDAATGSISGSTAVGSRPVGLAATDTGVWVAAQSSGTGHRGGRLVVFGSFDSIDPSTDDSFPDPLSPVYDALIGLRYTGGSAGTELVPDLASNLPQPTAGGTSYTVELRPQIRYSDGRPVQAADFRRGLERLLRLDKTELPTFAHLVGVSTCRGASTCDLTTGVRVDGPLTITFRLSSPDPRFLEGLLDVVPIPNGTPDHDVGTIPVPGTGPYRVQSFLPARLLVLDRNPYFRVWSPVARPDGYPDEVVYRADADENDAVRQVVAGKADLVQLLDAPAALAGLAATHPMQVHPQDQQGTAFLFVNTRRAPFDDVRVRRAVNYAVDRDRLVTLNGAPARPTCQLVAPTMSGYQPYCPYTVDPDPTGRWKGPDLARAKALVDASGTKGQPVVLWTFADYAADATYLAGVLDQLGYPTSVHETADLGNYLDALNATPNVQAGMFGWFGDPLAVDMLTTVTCDFVPNPAHFCEPTIDAHISQLAALQASDPFDARSQAASIDREITDQAPWVPLFTPETIDVTSSRIGNYQSVRGDTLTDQLWVQ